MNALGANLLLASQKGKMTKHTQPITIMAIILGFCHLSDGASEIGIKINEIAAESKRSPITSSSNQIFRSPFPTLTPAHGERCRYPSFLAFRMLTNRAKARGRKAAGSTIAHRP
jgi:hypothetical protein